MKIIEGYPPNYNKIKKYFPVDQHSNVVMCYGDTIYNPFGHKLRSDLIHHESVHREQQGKDIEGWWNKYLLDSEFRILQEAEAYGKQVAYIRRELGGLMADRAAASFARFLSGDVYGNAINRMKAAKLIARFSE